jgi:hypothetical protein
MGVAPATDEQIAKLKSFLIEKTANTQQAIPPELAPEVAERVMSKSVRPGPDGGIFATPADSATGRPTSVPTDDAAIPQHPGPGSETVERGAEEQDTEQQDPDPEPESPAALAWITAEQRNLLESEIDPIRGGHQEWLPDELDRRRPGWRTEQPQELAGWFDGIIVDLAMVSEEVVELENYMQGETERIMTDFVENALKPVLEQLSEQERAALTDEDIAELMNELFREDFEAITSTGEQG